MISNRGQYELNRGQYELNRGQYEQAEPGSRLFMRVWRGSDFLKSLKSLKAFKDDAFRRDVGRPSSAS